jgi:hypothetical protein
MEIPMKTLEKLGAGVLIAPFLALLFAGAMALGMLYAWCAARIWAWHVMPLAPWVPALTWKGIWGISAITGLMFKRVDFEEKKDVEGSKLVGKIVGLVIAPLVVLALAWWLK